MRLAIVLHVYGYQPLWTVHNLDNMKEPQYNPPGIAWLARSQLFALDTEFRQNWSDCLQNPDELVRMLNRNEDGEAFLDETPPPTNTGRCRVS
eukprot:4873220-Amphidinium_carterae.1